MYNYHMGQNGKIRLYIAGLAAILLIAATIATVMVLRLKGNGDGQQEPATPSGTVELSAMDPVEVQQTAVTDSQGSSSEGSHRAGRDQHPLRGIYRQAEEAGRAV